MFGFAVPQGMVLKESGEKWGIMLASGGKWG
jgi:hypothetical protein